MSINQLASATVDAASISFFCWTVYVLASVLVGAA